MILAASAATTLLSSTSWASEKDVLLQVDQNVSKIEKVMKEPQIEECEWFNNCKKSEVSEKEEGIEKLKLKKWKFYLLEVDWIKTLVQLDDFKPNKYLDWEIAPAIKIYSEYEKDKYFKVLATFVLPKWKWNTWDTYNWERYFRNLPFGYKLISYDKEKWTMDLEFISRFEWNLNITEQNNLSQFDLKTRKKLTDNEIQEIYQKIEKKLDE